MQLLLLSLLVCFGSPTQTYSNPPALLSNGWRANPVNAGFIPALVKWKLYLSQQVIAIFGDTARLHYRIKQVNAESNWNPRATSDFKNWKKQKLDTVTAIRNNMGAAGLTQFIFATAARYGAQTILPNAAAEKEFRTDIYNPFWSLRAMCLYLKNIQLLLISRSNPKVRTQLLSNKKFIEQCVTASYNCGEGRLQLLLKQYSEWNDIKYRLPLETQNYTDKITKD